MAASVPENEECFCIVMMKFLALTLYLLARITLALISSSVIIQYVEKITTILTNPRFLLKF